LLTIKLTTNLPREPGTCRPFASLVSSAFVYSHTEISLVGEVKRIFNQPVSSGHLVYLVLPGMSHSQPVTIIKKAQQLSIT
jgi:hypothetical protein